MRHIISILIENEAGALSRVAGLFSARGYNIASLTVAPTEDETLSRMTIVTIGNDAIIEQITKQLNKLIDVVKLLDLAESPHVERELMLLKVKISDSTQADVKRLVDIFCGKIIDVTDSSYVIEAVGTADKLDAFVVALNGNDGSNGNDENSTGAVIEVVRSGSMGMLRGEQGLYL